MRLIYLSGFLFIVSVFMVCGFFREFRPFIGAKLAKKNNEKKNKFFVEEITLASGEGFFVRFFFFVVRAIFDVDSTISIVLGIVFYFLVRGWG